MYHSQRCRATLSSTPPASANVDMSAPSVRAVIFVPREAVGFVIGRGGETVRNMSQRSGAHIAVDHNDTDPHAENRIFNLHGTPEQIAVARDLIREKVNAVLYRFQRPQSTTQAAATFQATDQSHPSASSNVPSNHAPRRHSGQTKAEHGALEHTETEAAQVRREADAKREQTPDVHPSSADDKCDKVTQLVESSLVISQPDDQNHEGETAKNQSASLGTDTARQLGDQPYFVFGEDDPPRPPLEMWIPRGKVGMIIGHYGQVINGMQDKSGATIIVHNKNEASDGSKLLTISGGEQEVQRAKSLIDDILSRSPRTAAPAASVGDNRGSRPARVTQAGQQGTGHPKHTAQSAQSSVPYAFSRQGSSSVRGRLGRERAFDYSHDKSTSQSAGSSRDQKQEQEYLALEERQIPAGRPEVGESSSIDEPGYFPQRPPDPNIPINEYAGPSRQSGSLHYGQSPAVTPPSPHGRFFPHGGPLPMIAPVPYSPIPFVPSSPGRQTLMPQSVVGMPIKEVRVPTSCVGIVIGKGGETIRDLQSRSGAYIKVTPDREAKPNDVERSIFISGPWAAIELAHNLLNDIVNEGLRRSYRDGVEPGRSLGSGQLLDTNGAGTSGTHEHDEFEGKAQLRVAGDQENNQQTQNSGLASAPSGGVQTESHTSPRGIERETSTGLEGSREGIATTRMQSAGTTVQTDGSGQGSFVTGPQQTFARRRESTTPLSPRMEGEGMIIEQPMTGYPSSSISYLMHVPNAKVGVIIGKGGQTIRELQQKSGARIVISKKVDTSREDKPRAVTITGPQSFVEAAYNLISAKIRTGPSSQQADDAQSDALTDISNLERPHERERVLRGPFNPLNPQVPLMMRPHPGPSSPVQYGGPSGYTGFHGQQGFIPVEQHFDTPQYQDANVAALAMRNRYAQQQALQNQQRALHAQQLMQHHQAIHQQAIHQQQQQSQAQLQAQVAMMEFAQQMHAQAQMQAQAQAHARAQSQAQAQAFAHAQAQAQAQALAQGQPLMQGHVQGDAAIQSPQLTDSVPYMSTNFAPAGETEAHETQSQGAGSEENGSKPLVGSRVAEQAQELHSRDEEAFHASQRSDDVSGRPFDASQQFNISELARSRSESRTERASVQERPNAALGSREGNDPMHAHARRPNSSAEISGADNLLTHDST